MLFARVGICYYWFIDMLLKQSFGYKKKRVYNMYLFTGYDENNPLKTVISRGEADGNKCYPGGQFNKHAKILIISLYF